MHERVTDIGEGIELAKRDCLLKEKWRLFYHGYILAGSFRREQEVRSYRFIDQKIYFFHLKQPLTDQPYT